MNTDALDNMDDIEYVEKLKDLSNKDLIDELLRQSSIYNYLSTNYLANPNCARFNIARSEVLNRFKVMSEGLGRIYSIAKRVDEQLDEISTEINLYRNK